MRRDGLSQVGLKLIACGSMLLDHIGAAVFPCVGLRIVGRLAFPIYCFLLAEGTRYTRNPGHYVLRLGIGALLSEIPFDLLFFGTLTLAHQNVMITLLWGLAMALWMKHGKLKILPMVLCAGAAELIRCDYGWAGIVMIWIFVMTEGLERKLLWRVLLLAAVCWAMDSMPVSVWGFRVPIELFAVIAMIPIGCYRGMKQIRSRAVQWGFYLFYPAHLAVLCLLV